MLNRRNFLKSSAGVIPMKAALNALDPASTLSAEAVALAAVSVSTPQLIPLPPRMPSTDPATEPWQQKIRRVGQSNMTEHDPAVMNIEEWANYWHSAEADIVFISVTGILAFYPSKVKFHRHGKFLNGRDFFGECVSAAKKRNMRVVARMSPDLNWGDALGAHPEWAMRNPDGSAQFSGEEPRLFKTCMFSTYMDQYVPAIMREVNSLYDVDCFYTNGWPPLGSLPECYCAICSKLPAANTPAYWRVFNDRVLELWQKYDAIAKEKKPDSFFFANLGGNVRGGPNLDRLGKIAAWFQADNQGRTYDNSAVWGCALQGRVCNAVLDGKFAANVTAAYSTGAVSWRNASKNPAEAEMWLNETLAGGMVPYYHFIGSENGFGEDRRWQKVGVDYFRWTAQHDIHFTTRRSIAAIGVVMGQSTQLPYPGPTTMRSRAYMNETMQGIYDALLRGRFAFDFVHEDRLEPERLSKYRALLLPNIAMLSDRQCQQIRDYVQSGGSIMASFETGLYDENLNQRADFGLAEMSASTGSAMSSARLATPTTAGSNANIPSWRASATPTGSPLRRIACLSSPCRIRCSPSSLDLCGTRRSWPTRRSRASMSRRLSCGKRASAEWPTSLETSSAATGSPVTAICCGCCTTLSAGSPATSASSTLKAKASSRCSVGKRTLAMPCICSTTPTPTPTTAGCSRSTRSARRPYG